MGTQEVPPKTRILFVDDEKQVLRVLQLSLKSMVTEWEMAFVESAPEALALMGTQPFDIVVSDMRMPGMSGAQLLNEVMQRYPRTVRIILSGHADQELVMRCVGATHQYLAKPCSPAGLRKILQRIRSLNASLSDDRLRTILTRLQSLPSVPAIYLQMIDALQSTESPLELITDLVARDPALTARMLQLVNSAFFGFASNVSTVAEAVQLLGVGTIRSLALSIHLFSAFDGNKFESLSIDRIWNHSLRVAMLARRIAHLETRDDSLMEEAFTGGLLHDVGKLILAHNLPQEYLKVVHEARARRTSVTVQEHAQFGGTHADAGAYLLGLWSLPIPLVETVAYHHAPTQSLETDFAPLTAVHAANAIDAERSAEENEVVDPLDMTYLSKLGLADRVAEWRNLPVSR